MTAAIEHSSSSSPLEEFLSLVQKAKAKDNNAAAATTIRTIIHQVLSHSQIYNGFDELHSLASSVLLDSSIDHKKALTTLELFSYGTYLDYRDNRGTYLTLTEAQEYKLKVLTIVSIAQQEQDEHGSISAPISYSKFQVPLCCCLNDIRPLEDLILHCLNHNLLSGKLDQRTMSFHFLPSALPAGGGRDVPLMAVPQLIHRLQQFHDRGKALFHHLQDDDKKLLTQNALFEKEFWSHVQERTKEVRNRIASTKNTGENVLWTSSTGTRMMEMEGGRRQVKRSWGSGYNAGAVGGGESGSGDSTLY